MIEAGVLNEDDRVELLDGWVVPKMTHKPPHDATVSLVQAELAARIPAKWILRIQSAITTSHSEPEPDVAVVRGPARRYVRSHPRGRDIALLVEVAERTLRQDRKEKGSLYARAGIPVCWIVNLADETVEVYTQPKGGRASAYGERQDYGRKASVPLTIAGQELGLISVRDLLP
jgi:Uma2 family endonuclease